MGLLLEQFVASAREFHNRLPQPELERRQSPIVYYTMHFTGGSSAVPPLEPRDVSSLSWDEWKTLTVSDVRGYHSIEQMHRYLSVLMRKTLIIETFLIPALVRAIKGEFQYYVDTYEQRVAYRQEQIQEIRYREADPELRRMYLDAARKVHVESVAEGRLPPEPFDEENYFKQEIEMFERLSTPDEKAKSERDLALWCDVTKEMLTPENLEKAKAEELEGWRQAYERDNS